MVQSDYIFAFNCKGGSLMIIVLTILIGGIFSQMSDEQSLAVLGLSSSSLEPSGTPLHSVPTVLSSGSTSRIHHTSPSQVTLTNEGSLRLISQENYKTGELDNLLNVSENEHLPCVHRRNCTGSQKALVRENALDNENTGYRNVSGSFKKLKKVHKHTAKRPLNNSAESENPVVANDFVELLVIPNGNGGRLADFIYHYINSAENRTVSDITNTDGTIVSAETGKILESFSTLITSARSTSQRDRVTISHEIGGFNSRPVPTQKLDIHRKNRRRVQKRAVDISDKKLRLEGLSRKDKFVKQVLFKYLYGAWTQWTKCNRGDREKTRKKLCVQPQMCGGSYIIQARLCKRCKKREKKNKCKKSRKNDKENYVKDAQYVPLVSRREQEQCGKQPAVSRGTARIVGGTESRPNAWPWQVAILEEGVGQFCGGTLIAPQWVLTAAHCIRKGTERRNVTVKVGEYNTFEPDAGEIEMKVEKDIPHPNYDITSITNDIALLKLERSVDMSTRRLACLPDKDDETAEITGRKRKSNVVCYILGWGKTKSKYIHGSAVLREAQIPLVRRDKCQKAFHYVIHTTQICAGSRRGGVDACAGDSGGPLLCQRKGVGDITQWVLYGVTSYGEGCGDKKKYGIYTNVRKYVDWIDNIIRYQ